MASAAAVAPLNICPCCMEADGKYHFVCSCGFEAVAAPAASGCPKCGCPWVFPGTVGGTGVSS